MGITLKNLFEVMCNTEEVYLTFVSNTGIKTFQNTTKNLLKELPADILYSCVDRIGTDEGDLFIDTSKENE